MAYTIARAIEQRLKAATPPKAVVLLGARRVGKTTLLNALPHLGRVEIVDGDFPRNAARLQRLDSPANVQTFLNSADTILIDEAQRIPDIGLILKRLVDANSDTRIFVTGSSSLDLAQGTRESALGRIVETQLWPLSLEEIAKKHGWSFVERNLERFMIFGTLPDVVTHPKTARETLTNYVKDLVLKDAFDLSDIRTSLKIHELLELLARRVGSEISFESLGNELKIKGVTVERYIKILEMCFVVRVVRSYSNNLANEIKKGKKVYFVDLGIRNALLDDFSPFSTRSQSDAGAIWENFFFMERLKMHSNRNSHIRQYFWRLRGARLRNSTDKPQEYSREIDFIEVQDGVMKAYECKLDSSKKDNGGSDFRTAYPECSIRVASPENALEFLSAYDWGDPAR